MRDDWSDHWAVGWWWTMIVMVAFWGGLIWLAVTLIRHGNHPWHSHVLAPPPGSAPAPVPPREQTPQEILALRLARGEIEPDDYRARLDALMHQPPADDGR